MSTDATARVTNGTDPSPVWKEIEDLRERARRAIQAGGLSQKRASVEIGISDAALSQWLKGKYQGDQGAIREKVDRWLESRAKRVELTSSMAAFPKWVETPTAGRILSALTYAQVAGDIAVVYGGAGTGKTAAARHYAGSHPNVWVVTMTASTRNWGPCLARVALACGIRALNWYAWRTEAELVERLKDTHGLLVIDEAQHLETRALEGLRGLHDASGIGLSLVGNDLVYARLTGGRRTAEYAQLFSRIGKRVRLTRPTTGDVDALLRAWFVQGRKEREQLIRIARSPGGLRGLTKTLRLAGVFADGEALTVRHLQPAWRDLGGV